MPQVGVMAVVEGLASFSSDVGKVNGLLDSMRPKATMLTRAFDSIGESLGRFAASVVHVVEYALGKLLADAIEYVVGKLRDLAAEALDAAAAFQILSLRLYGMNLQTLVDSGVEYTAAMKIAEDQTKENLTWVMKLAAVTPYDATDIANVFTLARSYGFASAEAQRLTQNTMNFAAGMGLGSEALERIIVNFGQMIQRGKITTREMNDLARGSMLPLADVLKRVADNMGMTVGDLTKLIQTADGVPAEEFIRAFNEMTESDVRFNGAAERMARTLKGASENITQTVRDLLGFYVIKPVFDVIGARLASIMDAIVDPKRWKLLTTTLSGIGEALGGIVESILGLVPSADTLADNLVKGLEGFRTWLEINKPGIIDFFTRLRDIVLQIFPNLKLGAIQTPRIQPITFGNISETQELPPAFGEGLLGRIQKIADFITDTLIPAFDSFKKWLKDNKPLIDEFFKTVGEIADTVMTGLLAPIFPDEIGKGEGGFLEAVKGFMQWVIDNKDEIAKWSETIIKLIGAFVILSMINTAIFTLFFDLLGLLFASPLTTVLALVSLFEAMTLAAGGISTQPGGIMGFLNLGEGKEEGAGAGDSWVQGFKDRITEKLTEWGFSNIPYPEGAEPWGRKLGDAIMDSVFFKIGERAPEIWEKLGKPETIEEWLVPIGIIISTSSIVEQAHTAADDFIKGFCARIGQKISDIKTTIIDTVKNLTGVDLAGEDIGKQLIDGMARGITNGTSILIDAITTLVDKMIATILDLLGISSPSTVTTAQGEDIVNGLVLGIENSTDLVIGAFDTLLDSVIAKIRERAGEIWTQFSSPTLGETGAAAEAGTNAGTSLMDALLAAIKERAGEIWTQLGKPETVEEMLPTIGIIISTSSIVEQAHTAADDFIRGFTSRISQKISDIKTTIIDTLKNLTGVDLAGENIGQAIIDGMVKGVENGTSFMLAAITTMVQKMIATIMSLLVIGSPSQVMTGIGENVAAGLAMGVENFSGLVTDAMKNTIVPMIGMTQDLLDQHSPSGVFEGIGENIVAGLARGIADYSGMVTDAMSNVVMPTMEIPTMAANYTQAQAVSNTSYQTSNAFNLNIHTNARTEPIIADFGMMQSMMGG